MSVDRRWHAPSVCISKPTLDVTDSSSSRVSSLPASQRRAMLGHGLVLIHRNLSGRTISSSRVQVGGMENRSTRATRSRVTLSSAALTKKSPAPTTDKTARTVAKMITDLLFTAFPQSHQCKCTVHRVHRVDAECIVFSCRPFVCAIVSARPYHLHRLGPHQSPAVERARHERLRPSRGNLPTAGNPRPDHPSSGPIKAPGAMNCVGPTA